MSGKACVSVSLSLSLSPSLSAYSLHMPVSFSLLLSLKRRHMDTCPTFLVFFFLRYCRSQAGRHAPRTNNLVRVLWMKVQRRRRLCFNLSARSHWMWATREMSHVLLCSLARVAQRSFDQWSPSCLTCLLPLSLPSSRTANRSLPPLLRVSAHVPLRHKISFLL